MVNRKILLNVLCGEGILCGAHSFVHSGSGVEFTVKFVLKGFDLVVEFAVKSVVEFAVKSVLNGFNLASRMKSRTPTWLKN